MRTCIFSDVHANLPALETFVGRTRGRVDAYVCLGDVVDYGPWNDECLEIVHGLPGAVVLEGNHERLFLGTEPIAEESDLVREFFAMSFARFGRRDLIVGLPSSCRVGDFRCSHTLEGRKIYADTPVQPTEDSVVGHTHHLFRVERSGRTLVGCGSVGQHRARGATLTYAVHDAEDGSVTLHEEPYPVDRFIQELVARGYPERCVEYYRRVRARGAADDRARGVT